ncbi:hypothetical protein PFICI_05065 [Pestalotiopsis fici W106-1]|uniref:VWFC domain-containing protein n=1 Tax=Pestalotiopsis fici (strain W106-1 / CGMCC3.15140) TaxID=1229662 RepID=W3XAX6_PESFW|nr:uncharacterized protein PFICI_05065 [Pestalotiopsis fici W106-1]ETS83189.1 hypothetical protein PFICI_05065 [Pestalotiopsis fici W106-1]
MLYRAALPALVALCFNIAGVAAIPAAQITPAPVVRDYGTTPEPSIPGSCLTTWDDFEHTTGGVSVNCFTYTSTTRPANCPVCTADSTLVCPLFIYVTTSQVPCSTDCCPTTATAYVDGACPTCGQCNIPTETIIETTGCPATATTTDAADPTETPSCWLPEGCPALSSSSGY